LKLHSDLYTETMSDSSEKAAAIIASHNAGMINVNVKTLVGKIVTVSASPSDTVVALKAKIEAEEGTPVASQTLMLFRKPLHDKKTLQEAEVANNTEVLLVVKKMAPTEASSTPEVAKATAVDVEMAIAEPAPSVPSTADQAAEIRALQQALASDPAMAQQMAAAKKVQQVYPVPTHAPVSPSLYLGLTRALSSPSLSCPLLVGECNWRGRLAVVAGDPVYDVRVPGGASLVPCVLVQVRRRLGRRHEKEQV